jgi:hypothetical protein
MAKNKPIDFDMFVMAMAIPLAPTNEIPKPGHIIKRRDNGQNNKDLD